MNSITLRSSLGLLLIGLLGGLIHQRISLRQYQAEIERLRAQAAQLEALQKKNQTLRQTHFDLEELERLRQEHLELARLRGEVSRLRQEKELIRTTHPETTTAPGRPVLITSEEGRRVVGDQLQQFKVEADGSLSTTNDAWISLNNTISRGFLLSGQVWLGGPSTTMDFPEDTPDGFAIYVREWDGMHRYAATTRYMQVKRRNWSTGKADGIIEVTQFAEPPLETWIPFTLEATREQITFRVGDQSGTIPGPLDVDGANKIALAPGSKVKDVFVQLLPEPDTSATEPGH